MVATLLLVWTERQYNFNVLEGGLSLTDNICSVNVFVYCRSYKL